MRYKRGSSGGAMVAEQTNYHRRAKFGALLSSTDDNTATFQPAQQDDKSHAQNNSVAPRYSSFTSSSPRYSYYYPAASSSGDASPSNNTNYLLSPYSNSSPYTKSPWIIPSPFPNHKLSNSNTGLIGSIVREEGHVYSLAASGGFLYSGSDSRNIRVWKNLKDFSGFKAGSGLVKAIVPCNDKIFTGHQDGKIRVWKAVSSFKNPNDIVSYKRTGSLPTFKDTIKSSVNPKNYVEVRRNKNVLRIKHYDAVSCLSLNEEQGLLYSGSWDKTVKVWRVKDYKCLESITAHDDAVNSVAAGFDSLVFTGSADGTVKVWRRELQGKGTRHFWIQTLLKQDHAVTSIAVNKESAVVYCGTSDGLVNFWERDKHLSHGGVLRGHKMAVLCLASAGSLVYSGSADRSVSVWRREEDGAHTWLSVLTGHGGPVKCLAVEEDNYGSSDDDDDEGEGRRWIVYSGSLDKSVRVWRVCENAPEVSSGKYQSPHRRSCYSPSSCSYSSSPTENGTYIRGKEGTETEECDASGV